MVFDRSAFKAMACRSLTVLLTERCSEGACQCPDNV